MNHEIKNYLYDIQESIRSIQEYIGDTRDFSVYQSNKMLGGGAVEQEFEIIGEAMSRINKIDPTIDISSKRQIISMRNRVIHGYDKVDDEIVWGTIIQHLPTLKDEIDNLLA